MKGGVVLVLASAIVLGACAVEPRGAAADDASDAPTMGAAGSAAGGASAAQFLSPLVRRLTREEIFAALTDSLGFEPSLTEIAAIPQDRPLEGFINVATSQTASPEHVAGYASVARAVSERIGAATLTSQGGCQDVSAACQAAFVGGLGRLLFRRPLDADELADFSRLFTNAAAESASFEAGARRVLAAMLQSPQFLYRLEHETAAATGLAPGERRTVAGYEMATRLSFLVWGSAPDAVLLQAAEDGGLDTAAGIAFELGRLLQDTTRVRRPTARFLLDWARLESLPESDLRSQLIESLLAFYQDHVWTRQAPLRSVFTSPRAFLTRTLAESLGVAPVADGVVEYDLSGAIGRRGLLAQPGMIAGMTNADGGAIVARGLFLQSNLFCGETPSPPASLQEQIDAFVAALPPNASDRQIAELRLQRAQCGACHASFDPLAYGLERFDFQGRYRERDEHGNELVTSGWIPGRFTVDSADRPYTGIDEYAELLAQSERVAACLTQKQIELALGRRLSLEQGSLVAEVAAAAAAQGDNYVAVLGAISAHAAFREMVVE